MIQVEYTDTYGGQANYSWVRRATLPDIPNESDRQLMRRIKRKLGLTGMRGRFEERQGDQWTWRPWGRCTILFIDFT